MENCGKSPESSENIFTETDDELKSSEIEENLSIKIDEDTNNHRSNKRLSKKKISNLKLEQNDLVFDLTDDNDSMEIDDIEL